jgi:hypothetical protein
MLYHGLEDGLVDTGRRYEMASDMVDVAKNVRVRLATADDGGRLHLRV